MKKLTNPASIASLLLGLIFLVFGLNFWLKFLPTPELPDGVAKDFMGALYSSGYLQVIKALEVIGGLLLISGRFKNLGLCIIGPIVVNILLFHAFLTKSFDPITIGTGVLAAVALLTNGSLMSTLFGSTKQE